MPLPQKLSSFRSGAAEGGGESSFPSASKRPRLEVRICVKRPRLTQLVEVLPKGVGHLADGLHPVVFFDVVHFQSGLHLKYSKFNVRIHLPSSLTDKSKYRMELEPYKYFHLYNRSNARELVFKNLENYLFFLRNFRNRFNESLNVIAYCLMPTHFHFLVQVNTQEIKALKMQLGIHLASYTKAYNNAYQRNGSLFQQHTKAKLVDNEDYLITLLTYIHQNPLRANLVKNLREWPFSSYQDLAGLRNGTLIDRSLINRYFFSKKAFIDFSEQTIEEVNSKYWV